MDLRFSRVRIILAVLLVIISPNVIGFSIVRQSGNKKFHDQRNGREIPPRKLCHGGPFNPIKVYLFAACDKK